MKHRSPFLLIVLAASLACDEGLTSVTAPPADVLADGPALELTLPSLASLEAAPLGAAGHLVDEDDPLRRTLEVPSQLPSETEVANYWPEILSAQTRVGFISGLAGVFGSMTFNGNVGSQDVSAVLRRNGEKYLDMRLREPDQQFFLGFQNHPMLSSVQVPIEGSCGWAIEQASTVHKAWYWFLTKALSPAVTVSATQTSWGPRGVLPECQPSSGGPGPAGKNNVGDVSLCLNRYWFDGYGDFMYREKVVCWEQAG